jgi:hypothetical protein
VPEAEGARVLAALIDSGYVEPFDDYWRTTLAGNALAMANAGPLIKRATAQRAYDAFLDRVEMVNAACCSTSWPWSLSSKPTWPEPGPAKE